MISNKLPEDETCAPYSIFSDNSCISLPVLISMAEAYNKWSEDNKIILNDKDIIYPNRYKKYLVRELTKRNSDKCTTQACWTNQEFIKYMNKVMQNELLKNTFKPQGPKGKKDWLSTLDIDNVSIQYFRPEDGKKFYRPLPNDFAKVPYYKDVNEIDCNKLLQDGIYKLGFIFNTHNHNQPGEHWVALYVNLKQGYIYYFDSVGSPPSNEVDKFMRSFAKFFISKNINYDLQYNKVMHQRKGTECGVYCLFFVISMSVDICFKKHCNTIVPDDIINRMRDMIFFPGDIV